MSVPYLSSIAIRSVVSARLAELVKSAQQAPIIPPVAAPVTNPVVPSVDATPAVPAPAEPIKRVGSFTSMIPAPTPAQAPAVDLTPAPKEPVPPLANEPGLEDGVLNLRTPSQVKALADSQLMAARYNQASAAAQQAGQPVPDRQQFIDQQIQQAVQARTADRPGLYLGFRNRQVDHGTVTPQQFQQELQQTMANLPEADRAQAWEDVAAGYTSPDFVADFNERVKTKKLYTVADLPQLAQLSTADLPEAKSPWEKAKVMLGAGAVGRTKIQELNAAIEQGKTAGQMAQDKVAQKVVETVAPMIDGANAADQQPGWMEKASPVFSDWRNWIAPAGALLTLFGGSMGKLLGGLMMVGGGVDLYQRYKGVEGLGATAEGQQAIQQLLTNKDEQGQPAPFANLETVMQQVPGQGQALKDLALLAKLGAKNQIVTRVLDTALQQGQSMGIPPATVVERLVSQGKITNEQGAEQLKRLNAAAQRMAGETNGQ